MTLYLYPLAPVYQAVASTGQSFVVMTQPIAPTAQSIADLTHDLLFNSVLSYQTSKQWNQMNLWVYIYKDGNNDLKVALTTSVHSILSYRQLNMPILYLRPFTIPFDAVAHKQLLSILSKKTVLDWIDKHKEETKIWLKTLN